MRLLSLDLSTKSSGYAIFIDGKLETSGIITSSSTDFIKRIYIMKDKINELLNEYDIDDVVLEDIPAKISDFQQKTK